MGQRNPWKTISSKIAYQTPWVTVHEDKVITPGGSKGVYSIVEVKSGVFVIALSEHNELYLISSFRYPLQAWRWEIPSGGMEEGVSPLETAQHELAEELGFRADTWTQLGAMYPSHNGPMKDYNFVFVAQGLHEVGVHHETGEAIRPPQPFPVEKVLEMVRQGELTDGQSLGALLHFKLWLDTKR